MSFLFPLGFLFFVSLPIIVWLHLRRQRLKRMTVPSLILWQNLPEPRRAQRKRRLPITLLLLLHLIIAALISSALVYPQMFKWLLDSNQHTVIVIDTSTSMAARDDTIGTRLDAARRRAKERIANMSPNDHISLVVAGPQAHLLTSGGFEHQANLADALDDLEAIGTGSSLDSAIVLAHTTLQAYQQSTNTTGEQIVVLSDLTPPADMPQLETPLEWLHVGENPTNRAIVALAARPRSNQANAGYSLYARFANYGEEPLTTPFRIFGDGELLDTHLVVMHPDGEVEYSWDIPPGISVINAEIDGKDPLQLDDRASIGLDQARTINTLIVSPPNESNEFSESAMFIQRVLAILPELQIATIFPADYATSPLLADTDLFIFDHNLPTAYPAGSVLIINPPIATETDSSLLPVQATQPVSRTTFITEHGQELLEDLNLDSVDFGEVASIAPPEWAKPLLTTRDNTPLILHGTTGQSNITIWAFDVAPLTTRLVYPLLTARTVRHLVPQSLPASVLAGQSTLLPISPRASKVELEVPNGDTRTFDISNGTQALELTDLLEPGIYTLREQHNDQTIYEAQFAVNTGTARESDLRPRPAPAAPDIPNIAAAANTGAGTSVGMQEDQQSVWLWFALAALVLLMVEWIYYTGQLRPRKQAEESG
jgi:hypothetical protein